MKNFLSLVNDIQNRFDCALSRVSTNHELEAIRIEYAGRTGSITHLFSQLALMSPQEKKEWGPTCNMLKKHITESITEKKKYLEQQEKEASACAESTFDVTAYLPVSKSGSLHPYTLLTHELEDIFTHMGYATIDGPELDTDFYNFEALNIPASHPARDMHDTFWLTIPPYLMRTHTSTVQVHALRKANHEFPLAFFSCGRVFRNEAVDATHDFMFHQGELFFVNKGTVSLSNLFATAKQFLNRLFPDHHNLSLRMRPGYFPFVEPGIEIDASCPFCSSGCTVCKNTRWIELLGAGLIHPHVLRTCSLDPDTYSGFALGFGLTRLAMIKYSIPDVRLFHSNTLEFLMQF